VRNAYDAGDWLDHSTFHGGGPVTALRAFQAYHPAAAIYIETYNGRTVWLTSKQLAIWKTVKAEWRQGKLLTLEQIAGYVGCSRSTVSRFLRRLVHWNFIRLVVLRGPGGGVAVLSPKSRTNSLSVVRRSMRIRQTKLARMIRRLNDFMSDMAEASGAPRVVVRVQLLLTNWLAGREGTPIV
jgi:predicted transcriptional regulator